MDPVSQAVVGAVVSGIAAKKEDMRSWLAIGALSAMSADLDILISSSDDPLLNLTFHRHFTHSLVFVPIGALICACVLSFLLRQSWKSIYLPAFLGYATAGPLDALTSYGTHLFWPFTQERTAWSVISIVDPIYTITLLIFVGLAMIKLKKKFIYVSLIFMLLWHSFGWLQSERAEETLLAYAKEKNIKVERVWVQPSIFNLFVWRALIESPQKIHVTCVHVGINSKIYHSGNYNRYQLRNDKKLKESSVLLEDIERFTHFSSGFVARVQVEGQEVLTDARYSPMPWGMDPLWALELNYKDPERHARMNFYRNTDSVRMIELWEAILGRGIFDSRAELIFCPVGK